MNKTVKILSALLALVLLASCLGMISCESSKPEQTTTTTATTTTTTTTTTLKDNNDPQTPSTVQYKVTVKDQNGDPVKDADVQMCIGELCKLPVSTDDNGVALFDVEEADYSVKFNLVPEGYAPDSTVYDFEGESRELVITLTKNS